MAPPRKKHNSNPIKCPHCVKPEKWCKNLSGLTQHINAVHFDFFRNSNTAHPSAARQPPPSISTHGESSSSYRHSPGPIPEHPIDNVRSDSSEEGELGNAAASDEPGHTDYHPHLNGE